MAVDADLTMRMNVAISLGIAKESFGEELSPEADELWDAMAEENAAILERGDGIGQFTPDLYDWPEWIAESPRPVSPPPPGDPPPPPEPTPAAHLAGRHDQAPTGTVGDDVASEADTGRPPPEDAGR